LLNGFFSPPDDLSSWFIIPCPRGRRCILAVQSHRTLVFGKNNNLMWTLSTRLPKQTILFCIYDKRSSIYHIVDIIMWNGQDYSTQVECQCRFFVLTSLIGDPRLNQHFQILPRWILGEKQIFNQEDISEDGYLFYHPMGFYESGYSPLVCWLKPFMIEEILGININGLIEKPDGYITARDFMLDEQSNRKENNNQQQQVMKSHNNNKKIKKKDETMMILDE